LLYRANIDKKKWITKIKEEMIIRNYLEKYIFSQITVTPKDVKKYYDDNKSQFKLKEGMKLISMLFKTRLDAEKALKEIKNKETFINFSNKEYHDNYNESVVYYKNDIADHLWKDVFRNRDRMLKKMTRRVSLNDMAELKPHRLRHFYMKSGHPIYIAKYGHMVACEESVPVAYRHEYKKHFEGFLMRVPKGKGLRYSLFKLQHLILDECRDANSDREVLPHVITYVREGEFRGHVGRQILYNGKICESLY